MPCVPERAAFMTGASSCVNQRLVTRLGICTLCALLIMSCGTGIFGCRGKQSVSVLPKSGAETENILLQRFPKGTALGVVVQAMVDDGFSCIVCTNRSLGDRGNVDFLYCTRYQNGSLFSPDEHFYKVSVVLSNETVSDIVVVVKSMSYP